MRVAGGSVDTVARLFLFLPLLLALACSSPDEGPPVTVTKRGDLTIESRPLPVNATLTAVGLGAGGDRREGSSEWESSFEDAEGRTEREGVRRQFRLTVVNRSATAREFHARIDYLDPEAVLVRRRSLKSLVVPPFTETIWSGAVLLPPPGNAEVVSRVLPSSEPFDPPAEP
jgi:hypothetical protein